jgi:hypothetical protein
MISSRYAPAIGALLAIALVPTFIHSYSRDSFDDGRRASAIPSTLGLLASEASSRNDSWGKRRFDSDDWMERDYGSGQNGPVTLTVIRSFDAKSVYHHPELAVAYHRANFAGEAIERSAARPEIPVHVLKPAPGVRAIGMYVLHYDERFIENPLTFQLRTAAESLFSRRKPMTLFFVLADRMSASPEEATATARALLLSAIDAFVAQRSGG